MCLLKNILHPINIIKYLNDKINEIEDYLIYSMEPVNLTHMYN
jgi:hypothetical protein